MFCPYCATQTTPDQKFCRACGMNLSKVSEAVAERAGSAPVREERSSNYVYDVPRLFRLVRLGLGVIGIGLLLGIIGKKIIFVELLTGIGALIAIIGMGLMAFPFFSAIVPVRASRKHSTDHLQPPVQPTSRNIAAGQEPMGIVSVTDRTTEMMVAAGEEVRSIRPPETTVADEGAPRRSAITNEADS